MTAEDRMLAALWRWVLMILLAAVVLITLVCAVLAHDHDHPDHNQWYSELRQPDNPHLSCCGEKDAYWCDDYFAKDGKAFCRVTDDRVIEGRPPVPVGTVIAIPDHKLKHDRGNPTGHAIVFGTMLSGEFYVYCFVQSGGV
jgi:hypothetical protein